MLHTILTLHRHAAMWRHTVLVMLSYPEKQWDTEICRHDRFVRAVYGF